LKVCHKRAGRCCEAWFASREWILLCQNPLLPNGLCRPDQLSAGDPRKADDCVRGVRFPSGFLLLGGRPRDLEWLPEPAESGALCPPPSRCAEPGAWVLSSGGHPLISNLPLSVPAGCIVAESAGSCRGGCSPRSKVVRWVLISSCADGPRHSAARLSQNRRWRRCVHSQVTLYSKDPGCGPLPRPPTDTREFSQRRADCGKLWPRWISTPS